MIRYHEALAQIEKLAKSLPVRTAEWVALTDARGRIAFEDIVCPEPLPPFDNSSMDGFAVNAASTLSAPLTLKVAGTIAAGDVPPEGTGAAWEIMTGAPLPRGCDAVVKIEDVKVVRDAQGQALEVQIFKTVASRNFLRPAGSDFAKGDLIVARGTRLQAAHVLPCAAAGVARLPVQPVLRVGLISTGRELLHYDQQLSPGAIRNSTAPYFAAAFADLGLDLVHTEWVGDEPTNFAASVRRAQNKGLDVLITTGAVSMGKYDFVAGHLKELGATELFHKVAIQPGKPLLLATLPGGPVVFGVPGNPLSGVVALRFFIEPFLRHRLGQKPEKPIQARLLQRTPKPEGLRQFAKARLHWSQDGVAEVAVDARQMSYQIRPFTEANAWAILPEDVKELEAGTLVDVLPLNSGGFKNVD